MGWGLLCVSESAPIRQLSESDKSIVLISCLRAIAKIEPSLVPSPGILSEPRTDRRAGEFSPTRRFERPGEQEG